MEDYDLGTDQPEDYEDDSDTYVRDLGKEIAWREMVRSTFEKYSGTKPSGNAVETNSGDLTDEQMGAYWNDVQERERHGDPRSKTATWKDIDKGLSDTADESDQNFTNGQIARDSNLGNILTEANLNDVPAPYSEKDQSDLGEKDYQEGEGESRSLAEDSGLGEIDVGRSLVEDDKIQGMIEDSK